MLFAMRRYGHHVPNWCENKLTVAGDPKQLAAFRESVRGVDAEGYEMPLSLEQVTPTPEEYLDGSERWREGIEFQQIEAALGELTTDAQRRRFLRENPGFAMALMQLEVAEGDWYEWRTQHWGTKWDLAADATELLESGEDEFCLIVSSAWSPIAPAISKLAARNPELSFELVFAEAGNWFAGRVTWKDGLLTSRDEHSDGDAIIALLEQHWPAAADWFRDHDHETAEIDAS